MSIEVDKYTNEIILKNLALSSEWEELADIAKRTGFTQARVQLWLQGLLRNRKRLIERKYAPRQIERGNENYRDKLFSFYRLAGFPDKTMYSPVASKHEWGTKVK